MKKGYDTGYCKDLLAGSLYTVSIVNTLGTKVYLLLCNVERRIFFNSDITCAVGVSWCAYDSALEE